jgi:hypothetical protein
MSNVIEKQPSGIGVEGFVPSEIDVARSVETLPDSFSDSLGEEQFQAPNVSVIPSEKSTVEEGPVTQTELNNSVPLDDYKKLRDIDPNDANDISLLINAKKSGVGPTQFLN